MQYWATRVRSGDIGVRSTVMVVDDNEVSVTLMDEMLSPYCRVETAMGGLEALSRIRQGVKPDLILLDLCMPDLDGREVMAHLRREPAVAEVPVILVSACDEATLVEECMASGANDVMTKPMNRELLLGKVFHHVHTLGEQMTLRRHVSQLEAELVRMAERNAQLEMACLCIPSYLTAARDADTGAHMRRTQAYLALLIRRMRGHAGYASLLTDEAVRYMVLGAALHDVGKVGLPDRILLKAGRFDAEERALMEAHSHIGGDAIASAQAVLGHGGQFLQAAQDMARYHHERWDGRGYPSGLSGLAIPLSARIMAVVDVFDALVSKRVYKSSLDFDQARAVMEQERGGLFDPQILDLFLMDYPTYVQIVQRCPDPLARSLAEVFQFAEAPVADH